MKNFENIVYQTINTLIGDLSIFATTDGIVELRFGKFDQMSAPLSRNAIGNAEDYLHQAIAELNEYFTGVSKDFTVPLDLSLISSSFKQEVLAAMRRIPYGETSSYTKLASAAGHPRAARAVGTACRTNPLPIIIPCHRIVPASGGIGQYAGGIKVKKTLLDLEGVRF